MPLIDGRYPTFQLGRFGSRPKTENVLIHSVMSVRVLSPRQRERVGWANEHPNQFEFTLGQPRSKLFLASDLVGQTERNSDFSLEQLKHGTSFELLVRQEVNRPVLKGPTEQVPQKAFDMWQSLAQQATEDFKQDMRRANDPSMDSWMVLSSARPKHTEHAALKDHYSSV